MTSLSDESKHLKKIVKYFCILAYLVAVYNKTGVFLCAHFKMDFQVATIETNHVATAEKNIVEALSEQATPFIRNKMSVNIQKHLPMVLRKKL